MHKNILLVSSWIAFIIGRFQIRFYLDKRNVYRPIPKQMLLTENGLFQSNRQNAPRLMSSLHVDQLF